MIQLVRVRIRFICGQDDINRSIMVRFTNFDAEYLDLIGLGCIEK